MRTYTLVFSIVVHVTVACAVLLSTVLATDELPEPRRTSVFVQVFAAPAPPASPPVARRHVIRSAPMAVIPLEAPAGLHAEDPGPVPLDPIDTSAGPGIVHIAADEPGTVAGEAPPPPPEQPAGPLRVGGSVRPPAKVRHVSPRYPDIARAAGVSGLVVLETTIDEAGLVRNVRVLRSAPLLDQAAVDAVQQWRFTPTLLNGQPVSVLMTVTVSFNLD